MNPIVRSQYSYIIRFGGPQTPIVADKIAWLMLVVIGIPWSNNTIVYLQLRISFYELRIWLRIQ